MAKAKKPVPPPPPPQVPMAGGTIPQWANTLPLVGAAGIPVVDGATGPITLNICEFQVQVLPPPLPATWVWGYIAGACPAAGAMPTTYIGPIVVAQRGVPTSMTFYNNLGTAASTNVLAWRASADQTLHWADPLGMDVQGNNTGIAGMNSCAMTGGAPAPGSPCSLAYTGPIPTSPHLHGGEVPPEIDGGPEGWFTNATGGFAAIHASNYYSSIAGQTNAVTFKYPNKQEASPIWFHDHAMGVTRLNVLAGLAGAYFVTDSALALPPNLPGVGQTIPVVLQDRMFDTNGQLFFPADNEGGVLYALNPEHPYWVPEFVGDTIVVNGKAWPTTNVEPKRYRFLFLNGSNARTYDLSLPPGVPIYVIGNDGGYLDSAVPVANLVMMPGERYELIIDFSGIKPGNSLILKNNASTPYPGGAQPQGGTLGQILKFNVVACATGGLCGAADPTFNPALTPAIRAPGQTMAHLVSAATGSVVAGVTVNKKRQLTLNEVMGMPPRTATDPVTGLPVRFAGGPLEILVNNTKWSGTNMMAQRTYGDFKAVNTSPMKTYISEWPTEGETEEWEIINLTADAHPIHLHLVQFQVLNRQAFDVKGYQAAYAGAFPGVAGSAMCPAKAYCPAFGPPLDYNVPNADGALGGNPSPALFLKGAPTLPAPQETGWKDTFMAPPGTVSRMIVRWSPTSTPVGATGAAAAFPFDPSGLDSTGVQKWGYVWHCHIIDHEDNEMMRPDYVVPASGATRSYFKGEDY